MGECIYELAVHTNACLCSSSLNEAVLYMRHVQLKPIQGCSWVKVLQHSEKKSPQPFRQESQGCTTVIPSAKTSLCCCLNQCTTASQTLLCDMNTQLPLVVQKHKNHMAISLGCTQDVLSTSHYIVFGWS
jgi:hypothetical protein